MSLGEVVLYHFIPSPLATGSVLLYFDLFSHTDLLQKTSTNNNYSKCIKARSIPSIWKLANEIKLKLINCSVCVCVCVFLFLSEMYVFSRNGKEARKFFSFGFNEIKTSSPHVFYILETFLSLGKKNTRETEHLRMLDMLVLYRHELFAGNSASA